MKKCNRKECIWYNEAEDDNCSYTLLESVTCTYDENCPAFEIDN